MRSLSLPALLLALLATAGASPTARPAETGAQEGGEAAPAPPEVEAPQEPVQEPAPDRGAAPAAALDAPPDSRSSRVDYDVRARLDGDTMRLAASETITWHNRSGDSVPDLWFHLYHNAFANNRSTHVVEAGGRLRGEDVNRREVDEWGWQRVTRVVVDGVDVTDTFRYRLPDSGEPDPEAYAPIEDRTVASVDLAAPVAPDQTVAIEVEWEAQLPRVRRRTGYKGDFLLVAHWFPKLGVYEGGRGWNCHEFHANSEFYSNFGTYRVALDLPAEYHGRVGGSGKKVLDEVQGDRVEVVFEAPSGADRRRPDVFGKLPVVHGFAWTGDPDYEVVKDHPFVWDEWAERYPDHVRAARRAFGDEAQLEGRDVDLTVLIQPERVGQARRHAEATQAALFFYGLWFGAYPYEHLTVVDPAWGAGEAAGMEYPALFTCGTRLGTTPDMHRPESVTIHEAGHQFWYGLVGNNEFEAAWLDEGFNSYTDSEVLEIVYGDRRAVTWYAGVPLDGTRPAPPPGGGRLGDALTASDWSFTLPVPFLLEEDPRLTVRPLRSSDLVEWWRDQPLLTLVPQYSDARWSDRAGYLRDPDSDVVDTWAFSYVDRGSYRTNSYPRPAVMLRTLRGLVGEEAFLRGMRRYSGQWRYRHPYPQDFFESFLEGAGVDVRWFLEDAFRSRKTIDWSVDVSQRRAWKPKGYFQQEATGEWRPLEELEGQDGGESADGGTPDDAAAEDEGGERPWQVTITLRRKGELCLPLRWRVTYDDGSEELFEWTREEQLEQAWYRWSFESPRKVAAVVLDPERVFYCDRDMSDNQWYDQRSALPAARWTASLLQQYQHVLHWFSGIGG